VKPVRIAFVVHNHQPVGNLDSVFADATARSYRPFLESLARHPGVRLSMHWSGPLLEWLESHDGALLDRLGTLVSSGQIELLTGPFYEPILTAIPPWDQQGQFERAGEYLLRRFGVVADGAWIPERVWEPDLPDVLTRCGVRYTLLDDHHFLLAGISPARLREPYWVESTLGRVGVFPIEKELRYRIPFAPLPELLHYLESSADGSEGIRVFGDDGEKFGVWPKTHDWVYGEGWLERWLSELEEGTRVMSLQLGEAWRLCPPSRCAPLPAASYPEMMTWALPPEAQLDFEATAGWLLQQGRGEVARRLAGGSWRAFLTRYPESRRAHRRVTALSARIESLGRSCLGRTLYDEARREIHRAQCNCAYWHGVFGGIYIPHLRQAVQEHLLRAESMADELQSLPQGWYGELDAGEARLRSSRATVAVDVEQSGDIVEIASRTRPFQFASVLARRPEAYHQRLAKAASAPARSAEPPDTIHGALLVREAGLERLLAYDQRPRAASQEWVAAGRRDDPAPSLREALDRGADVVRYRLVETRNFGRSPEGDPSVELSGSLAAGGQTVRKVVAAGPGVEEFRVALDGALGEGEWLLSEWNLSLLGPDAPRRLTISGRSTETVAPGSRGGADGVSTVRLEDASHLGLAVSLSLDPPARLEWAPVETVSLSEGGIERLYQGTSLLIGWRAESSGLKASVAVRVEEVSVAA